MDEPDIDKYIAEHEADFADNSVTELLEQIYRRSTLSKVELAVRSDMSEVYLHQLFAGRRKASRDRLLSLCLGLGATPEETQEMLRRSGYAELHPKVKRDAIILHSLMHGKNLIEVNGTLFDENEKSLC